MTRRGPDRDAASVGRTAHDLIFPEVNGAGLEPGGKFAAVYEQTCLCALPPARWEEYEALLARWLEPGGGVTACGISTREQGLVDQFLPFFTNWHWRGPAEVELKRDARDGVFKVIEINPRFPGYLRLPSVCGIELAVLAARSVVGDEPTRVVRPAGWRRFLGKNADVVGGLVT